MVKGPRTSSSSVSRFQPFDQKAKVLGRSQMENNQKSCTRISCERDELRDLYRKLQNIIPSCQSKPTSSVDIVLGAVEYIRDLHSMLDKQLQAMPVPVPPPTSQQGADALRRICHPRRKELAD